MQDTTPTLLFYTFYLITFILSYQIKWKTWNWYVIISFTLIVGLRGVGIDYHGYKELYKLLVNLPYGLFDPRYYNAEVDQWSTIQFEPFYVLVIKILKIFHAENYAFFCVIAFGQIFFYENFVRRFRPKEKMMMGFVFFGGLLFIETFNGMRQFMAFFAYLNIVHYIAERKWKQYFGYGILLYCLHSSAVFLLPLYFFINYDVLKDKRVQMLIYLGVMFSTTYLKDQLAGLLDSLYLLTGNVDGLKTSYLNSETQALEESGKLFSMTHVYRLLTLLFIVWNGSKFKEAYGKLGVIYYNMTYIGYLLSEVSFNMGIYRINYYFFYNVFIVMGLTLYQTFYIQRNALMKLCGVGIVALYYAWLTNAVLKSANECSPYKLNPKFYVECTDVQNKCILLNNEA